MKNEAFREVGFWGSMVAAVVGLVNCIILLVKGIKISGSDPMSAMAYPADNSFDTILYKVSVGILAISLISMLISFLVNTDGALRVFMIVMKVLQAGCIAGALIGLFVMHDLAIIKLVGVAFAAIELIVFILYLIDSDHRKTIIRVALLTILTVGSGAVFFLVEMLLMLLLVLTIVVLLFAIFFKTEKRVMILDANGKFLGWLVTRD